MLISGDIEDAFFSRLGKILVRAGPVVYVGDNGGTLRPSTPKFFGDGLRETAC